MHPGLRFGQAGEHGHGLSGHPIGQPAVFDQVANLAKVAMRLGGGFEMHHHLRGGEPLSGDPPGLEAVPAQVQPRQITPQGIHVKPRIEAGPEDHVPAGPTEAIEISHPHAASLRPPSTLGNGYSGTIRRIALLVST